MIAVIGGGASGLMGALTAAEHNDEVVLLERQPRVGRMLHPKNTMELMYSSFNRL